jgi:hypothetical protein
VARSETEGTFRFLWSTYTYIEGSTGYFMDNFRLEGLDFFNIGGMVVPHIAIPCVHIGMIILLYMSSLLSSVSLERSSKSRIKSLYPMLILFLLSRVCGFLNEDLRSPKTVNIGRP